MKSDFLKGGLIAKAMLLLSTVIWGSTFFIIKNALDEIPPFFLLSVRFFFSALLLGIICWKKWKLFNREYLWKGALAGVFLALAYIFQTVGLQHTTPGNNAFLTTVYCVLVPFMFWGVTRRKPSVFNVAAAVVCVAGIGLVCLDGGGMKFTFMGEGMTLLCGVFFALQIVAVGVQGKKLDVMLYTVVQFGVAFAVCFLLFLCTEKFPTSVSSYGVFSLSYVTVVATCLCFVMMNVGIKRTSAASAALILSLEAVFGVAFSLMFYHERPGAQTWVGFVVIFAAVLLSEAVPALYAKRKNAFFPSLDGTPDLPVYARETNHRRSAENAETEGLT